MAFLNRQERAATAKDMNKTAYLLSKTDANKSISADDRTERHPRIREKDAWAAILRKMKEKRPDFSDLSACRQPYALPHRFVYSLSIPFLCFLCRGGRLPAQDLFRHPARAWTERIQREAATLVEVQQRLHDLPAAGHAQLSLCLRKPRRDRKTGLKPAAAAVCNHKIRHHSTTFAGR